MQKCLTSLQQYCVIIHCKVIAVVYEKFIPWVISTGYQGKDVVNIIPHATSCRGYVVDPYVKPVLVSTIPMKPMKSPMNGIDIHYVQHFQAKLELGV